VVSRSSSFNLWFPLARFLADRLAAALCQVFSLSFPNLKTKVFGSLLSYPLFPTPLYNYPPEIVRIVTSVFICRQLHNSYLLLLADSSTFPLRGRKCLMVSVPPLFKISQPILEPTFLRYTILLSPGFAMIMIPVETVGPLFRTLAPSLPNAKFHPHIPVKEPFRGPFNVRLSIGTPYFLDLRVLA